MLVKFSCCISASKMLSNALTILYTYITHTVLYWHDCTHWLLCCSTISVGHSSTLSSISAAYVTAFMETIVHYNNNSAIDYKVTHTSLATSSEKFPACNQFSWFCEYINHHLQIVSILIKCLVGWCDNTSEMLNHCAHILIGYVHLQYYQFVSTQQLLTC